MTTEDTAIFNEVNYASAPKEDLIARLMTAQMYGQFLLKAYTALLSYGVNYKTLRVFGEMADLAEKASKLKPIPAQELFINYFTRLENDLAAAVRRKVGIKTIVDNTDP